MSCLVGFFDRCVPAVKRAIQKCCPCVYRLFWGGTRECIIVKTILRLAFGVLLGAALHFQVISRITLIPPDVRVPFGASLTVLIAAAFALSLQLRCIMILVLPNFFGRHGRSLLASVAFVLLLTSPVNNIIDNAKESARAISCSASLTFNHSKELFVLLHKPFHDAFRDIGGKSEEIERDAKKVQVEFQEFEDEIEGDDLTNKGKKRKFEKAPPEDWIVKMYTSRNSDRCDHLFDKGVQECKKEFQKMEKKCYEKKGGLLGRLFCWPLKFTAMCRVMYIFHFICDEVPDPPPGVGDMYLTLMGGIHSFDENFKVKLRWQMTTFPDILNGTSIPELRARMAYEMRVRKQWFEFISGLAKVILSFAFILVFTSASSYNSKYLTNISFDNVYLTAYFRKIDARRKKQNKRTLLPQKKGESNDIIEAARWKLRREEKKSMVVGTLRLLMQVILTVVLVFFDYLFYNMLDLIARHSHVDYTFKGEHVLKLAVLGKGMVAKLFRKVLSAFDQRHAVDKLSTNKHCLPRPSPPDSHMIVLIFSILVIVWLLLYLQAYGLRLRRIICAYFYPKKEKQRVLFLYNETLKKRIGFLKYMRLKVRTLARERKLQDSIGTLTTLRQRCPRLCCWMAICKLGRRKCLVCEDYENETFHECETEGCDFIYCDQCWQDVKENCYACRVYDDSGSEDEFFSDD